MSPHKNEKGFILFYTLIIIGILSIITESYFMSITNDLQTSSRAADSVRAYYTADAGLADIFMRLRATAAPGANFSTGNIAYPVGTNAGVYNAQWVSDGTPWPTYTLTSVGTYGNTKRTLSLSIKTSSFSKYGYFSNTENDPVWGANWFITGMITTGPAHTNGQFSMFGTPVFTDIVTQVAPTINYWSGPPADNPDFENGYMTGAPAVNLPPEVANQFINNISNAAQQPGGVFLNGDSVIIFLQDGTMNITNTASGWNNQNMPVPANGALFVNNGVATVQGVLKGSVTIGTNSSIFIGGNTIYQNNPRVDPTSKDLLGLVARNNVTITDQGPYNIEIDAYIVALQGQFSVRNFWNFLKGDMVQFGGLTTNLPGGLTGIFNPWTGQMVAGYNQLQYIDPRLKTQIPLYFPAATDANNRTIYTKVAFKEITNLSGVLPTDKYEIEQTSVT